jgi:acetyl-CoA carboxylase carboxyl transferase subunit beta
MPIKLPSFRPRRDAYPPDLWTKCPSCEEMLFNKQLDKVQRVCPSCGHHFRLSAAARLALLLDHGTFVERDAGLQSVDPLGFVDQKSYPDRLAAAQLATGMRDAAVWGTGTLDGRPVAICVMDFGFMGGSMGAVVGEKVTRAAEYALAQRLPLVVVSASGGARMQEGTLALMQLAKTIGALERLRAGGVPYVSVLSDPTTGGVFASFAVLGDINLAEPNALIGFAGARVSAGTIAQELPAGFQRSEFLFQHGFLDRVVHRSELRGEIARFLGYLVPASRRNGTFADEPEPLGLPSFRPLSFLSNLAERVMPSEPDAPTNGSGSHDSAHEPAAASQASPESGAARRAAVAASLPAVPAHDTAEAAVPDPVEQEPERAPERTVDADAQDAANPERPQDAERG